MDFYEKIRTFPAQPSAYLYKNGVSAQGNCGRWHRIVGLPPRHLTSGARLPTLMGMATLPNNIGLSSAEKFELLDALWEDLETDPFTLSAEQAEELDGRIREYEVNPPAGTPWEQVKAGLHQR
jgi:putative addiction module component (TIGR02574 family)